MPGTPRTRAYLEGVLAPNGTGSIVGQDDQDFVASSLFDQGVWSSLTTYVVNDLVQDASGNLWRSLTNPNLNNTPIAGANWTQMGGTAGSFTVATLPTPGTPGRIAWASDARNVTELPTAGTGCLVTDNGSAWLAVWSGLAPTT
jgi:hypothetical protein